MQVFRELRALACQAHQAVHQVQAFQAHRVVHRVLVFREHQVVHQPLRPALQASL